MSSNLKLWIMLLERGSEIDNPSEDKLYLTIERAIVLSDVISTADEAMLIGKQIGTKEEYNEIKKELMALLKELNIL